MTLPAQMIDRWHNRPESEPGAGTLYWHMLMKDQPAVVELARQARQRLAPFAADLHMTPPEWLHITTAVAGSAASFTSDQLRQMTRTAAKILTEMPRVTVTVGRILYHPEAIMLGVAPAQALRPIQDAAVQATQLATGNPVNTDPDTNWLPHITICYSTSSRPAQPLIDALGLELPGRDLQIGELSLVLQNGAERSWDWHIIDNIRLDGEARI